MRKRNPILIAALALVLLAACGGGDDSSGGGGTAAGGSASGGTTVDIAEFNFKPQTLTVSVGAAVTWTNKDSFAHSVESNDKAFPTSPSLDQGKAYTFTFTKAGTYPYICGIHNSMTGTVIVK